MQSSRNKILTITGFLVLLAASTAFCSDFMAALNNINSLDVSPEKAADSQTGAAILARDPPESQPRNSTDISANAISQEPKQLHAISELAATANQRVASNQNSSAAHKSRNKRVLKKTRMSDANKQESYRRNQNLDKHYSGYKAAAAGLPQLVSVLASSLQAASQELNLKDLFSGKMLANIDKYLQRQMQAASSLLPVDERSLEDSSTVSNAIAGEFRSKRGESSNTASNSNSSSASAAYAKNNNNNNNKAKSRAAKAKSLSTLLANVDNLLSALFVDASQLTKLARNQIAGDLYGADGGNFVGAGGSIGSAAGSWPSMLGLPPSQSLLSAMSNSNSQQHALNSASLKSDLFRMVVPAVTIVGAGVIVLPLIAAKLVSGILNQGTFTVSTGKRRKKRQTSNTKLINTQHTQQQQHKPS